MWRFGWLCVLGSVASTGMELSPTRATGTAFERMPWRGTQRASGRR